MRNQTMSHKTTINALLHSNYEIQKEKTSIYVKMAYLN